MNRLSPWGAALSAALAGREPVFVKETMLAPGTLFWAVEYLPRVFMAPDVYDVLLQRRAVLAAIARAERGQCWAEA
jgi:hypothetical protein